MDKVCLAPRRLFRRDGPGRLLGALVKSALKEKINSLIKLLEQPLPDEAYKSQGTETASHPIIKTQSVGKPIPVKTHDTSKNAQMGLYSDWCR